MDNRTNELLSRIVETHKAHVIVFRMVSIHRGIRVSDFHACLSRRRRSLPTYSIIQLFRMFTDRRIQCKRIFIFQRHVANNKTTSSSTCAGNTLHTKVVGIEIGYIALLLLHLEFVGRHYYGRACVTNARRGW